MGVEIMQAALESSGEDRKSWDLIKGVTRSGKNVWCLKLPGSFTERPFCGQRTCDCPFVRECVVNADELALDHEPGYCNSYPLLILFSASLRRYSAG